jgi:3',5'-cyclic AMP phosphodiesterase CpdA
MPTLIHLSDLHFGDHYVPRLGELVLQDIDSLNPDVVVVSGDFTMRARHREYDAAREYLARIKKPKLMIPGNHDQPLLEPWERLVSPFGRYKKNIGAIDSTLEAGGFFIAGLNDNDRLLPGGFWSKKQHEWLMKQFDATHRHYIKIVVTHHQMNWNGKMRPAGFWNPTQTLKTLAQREVELVLNGHTHVPNAIQTPEGVVISRSGTTTSSRTRNGTGNGYNLITVSESQISVFVRMYDSSADKFTTTRSFVFERKKKPSLPHA